MLEAQWGCARPSPWLHPGGLCVALFRIAHQLWHNGHRKSARLVSQICFLLTGGEIHPACHIGPGLLIPHPCGVAILCDAGRNLTALSRSGTGMLPKDRDVGAGSGVPLLGNDCILGPCTGVEGPQRVGNGVVLVTGVALTDDAPDGARLASARPGGPGGAPAVPADEPPRRKCPHRSLAQTWRDLVADMDAQLVQARGRTAPHGFVSRLSALLTSQLMALALHRASHLAHACGWMRSARLLAAINRWASRAAINPASCVAGGWYLPHPAGVLFNADAGAELVMFAYTIAASDGNAFRDGSVPRPRLGERVVLAAHSCVLGPLAVGDNARLGFGAHLRQGLASDRLAIAPGARAVRAETAPASDSAPPGCDASEDTGARATLAADWARLRAFESTATSAPGWALRLSPAWVAVRLFRASRRAFVGGRVQRARRLWQLNMFLTGADLRPWSCIGPGLLIPNPAGDSVNGHAGRNLTVNSMAGIDAAPEDAAGARGATYLAHLGDDVTMGHHAGVVGSITVGTRVILEAGARITSSVADATTCVDAGVRTLRTSRHTGALSIEAQRPSATGPKRR